MSDVSKSINNETPLSQDAPTSDTLAPSEQSASAQEAAAAAAPAASLEHLAERVDMPPAPAEIATAKLDWGVVLPAAVLLLLTIAFGLAAPDTFANYASSSLSWVITSFGWLFVTSATLFVFYIAWLGLSRYGSIRLGGDDEAPEFRTISWIAMMFAAGMGIGLVFYGVAEPLSFYRNGVPGHEPHEVGTAMAQTMFHWTLHPWAIYSVVALSIAYGTFRLGRKQLISSAFIPLIGVRRAEGWFGKLIDVLAIVATVFGTATSLGLGALQIGAGLELNGWIDSATTPIIVGIIGVLGACFLLSALSGVGKGIQYLSNTNMLIAAGLVIFIFIAGPTVYILDMIPTSVGMYLDNFFEMVSRTANSADGTAGEWLGGWTIFYWAWWISWSPFVGMFLARISRGRTIREFIGAVLLVPSAVSVVWFAVFGGGAIRLEQLGDSIFGDGAAEPMLFNLIASLPLAPIISVVTMLIISIFFITSADSASIVMGSMSQRGLVEPNRFLAAMWGTFTAAIAIILLVTGGDEALSSLQSMTILAASPFVLVLLGMAVSLTRGVQVDPLFLSERQRLRFAQKLATERRMARDHRPRPRRRASARPRHATQSASTTQPGETSDESAL